MLVVEGLTRPGLEPAALVVAAGECIAVRGPSGAGKTLLLRAIADLDPNEGSVTLDGILREAMPAPEWRRQVIYLAAEPGWWAERVAQHFDDWRQVEALAQRLLLPPSIGAVPVARLSTGERQRLAVLRAVCRSPRVLLLDEPTAALDAAARDAVEVLLDERRRGGTAILWVTHDLAQALRVASRRLTVEAGRVREDAA
jgi:putative ABC transport system ATP-binding protein